MHRKLHTRISPASLLSIVALFVSLGGVSYAAATIGSAEIKNNSIRSKDVRNGTLTAKDVRKNTLGGNQIDESKLGQVPSALSADSALQAQKAVDAENAVNAQKAQTATTATSVGPNGVNTAALQNGSVRAAKLGATVQRTKVVSVAAGTSEFETVSCAAGERMLSGGASWSNSNNATAPKLHIVHSYPSGTTAWSARGYNGNAAAQDLTVRALCLGV